MSRKLILLLSVALVLSGCANATNKYDPAAPTTLSQQSDTEVQPPITNVPKRFVKALGEMSGFQCDPSSPKNCDVLFTITDIETVPTCSTGSAREGNEFLRFVVEITTPPAWRANTSALTMLWENWGVVSGSGFYDQSPSVALACDSDMDAFYKELPPDSKIRGTAVIDAPKGSTAIRYTLDGISWEWKVPN